MVVDDPPPKAAGCLFGLTLAEWGIFAICGFASVADATECEISSNVARVFVNHEWFISNQDTANLDTLKNIAFAVSGPVLGAISDSRGRRPAFIGAAFIWATFGLVSAFAPTWTSFCALRFISCLGGGIVAFSVVILAELMPPNRRDQTIMLIGPFWSVGLEYSNVLSATLLPDHGTARWRLYCALMAAPALLLLVWAAARLPESPVWLRAQRQSGAGVLLADAATEALLPDAARLSLNGAGGWEGGGGEDRGGGTGGEGELERRSSLLLPPGRLSAWSDVGCDDANAGGEEVSAGGGFSAAAELCELRATDMEAIPAHICGSGNSGASSGAGAGAGPGAGAELGDAEEASAHRKGESTMPTGVSHPATAAGRAKELVCGEHSHIILMTAGIWFLLGGNGWDRWLRKLTSPALPGQPQNIYYVSSDALLLISSVSAPCGIAAMLINVWITPRFISVGRMLVLSVSLYGASDLAISLALAYAPAEQRAHTVGVLYSAFVVFQAVAFAAMHAFSAAAFEPHQRATAIGICSLAQMISPGDQVIAALASRSVDQPVVAVGAFGAACSLVAAALGVAVSHAVKRARSR